LRLTDKDSVAKERAEMQAGEIIVGVDISKATFDVVLRTQTEEKHKVFSNNPKGYAAMVTWLEKQPEKVVRICSEATGSCWEGLAEHLYGLGYMISVINPYQIKKYADHLLNRNKTDKADAKLIAEFCDKELEHLRVWKPYPEEIKTLRSMERRLDELQGMKQQEQNRQKSGVTDPVVLESLQDNLRHLEESIQQLKQKIKNHIDQHPDLKSREKLLTSISGIGKLTADRLLAEIGDIGAFESASQLAAYAGLAPKQFRSGTSVHKKTRISKQGRRQLRSCLFMPAIVALGHNPVLLDLKRRMLASGHAKMEIVVAAMKKLLHLVFGVLKNNCRFDPNYALNSKVTP
jgi:transposase